MKEVDSSPAVRVAAAYIRVSTDDQVELSPASQLVEIRKWAAAHSYVVPDEFVFRDEGISGRHTDKRDAFKRMIGTAKQKPKPFDAILLWKYSRFARNREDAVLYKSMLRKQCGIDVLSISEPTADGAMGVITEALIEAMDEFYSLNLGQEVRRGMAEKHRRGEWQSTPPYGYTVKEHRLTPIEPEASYVREIFRRFLAGEGTYPLARWLNECGQRTHRGSPFENRTVEYMLYNPVYAGKIRRSPSGRDSSRYHQGGSAVIVDGIHEPLISQEDFDAAQGLLARRKAARPYRGKPAECQKDWLSGLVRCSVCGATMVQYAGYWRCNNYVHGRCRVSQHVTDEHLRGGILSRLSADLCNSGLNFRPVRASDGSADEQAAIRSAIASANRSLERVKEAYRSGVDTLQEYSEHKCRIQAQLDELTARLESTEAETSAAATPQAVRSAIRSTLDTLNDPSSTVAQKYAAAHSIIDTAIFDKSAGTLQVKYRLIL